MNDAHAQPHTAEFSLGMNVEVINGYEARWSSGFEIAGNDRDRYLLRRRSDGSVLPVAFPAQRLRPGR